MANKRAGAGKYFIFMNHRYYRIRGGMTKDFAYDRMNERRRLAPQFFWAINRDSDGTWSLGRRGR